MVEKEDNSELPKPVERQYPRPPRPRTRIEKQLGIAGLTKDMLLFYPTGIELGYRARFRTEQGARGQLYEDKCFTVVTEETTDVNSLVIGPRLLNYLLKVQLTAQEHKPDTFTFRKDSRDLWVLTDLYEFRLKKVTNTGEKLRGFSRLLAQLRKNSSYLPAVFNLALGSCLPVPSRIKIPSDADIRVTFIKPSIGEVSPFTKTSFKIRRLTIPYLG